jgi:hypothetical protein
VVQPQVTILKQAPNRHEIAQGINRDLEDILDTGGIKPYNIWLSPDPFGKPTTVQITTKENHPTLGMITNNQ